MKPQQIVRELEETAGQLGLAVRREKGNFRGGRCVVGDAEMIVLNKRHLPEVHLVILAESLRDEPLETVFLRPAVRHALEDAWARLDAATTDLVEAGEAFDGD